MLATSARHTTNGRPCDPALRDPRLRPARNTRSGSSHLEQSRILRAEVTSGCRCKMMNSRPVARASSPSRRLKSSSSPANNSWLNPPTFRKAAALQKINDPASNRRLRLGQFHRPAPKFPMG